ncbi:hypothetical protein HUJ04_001688 [Dendroctonus ponderosae]|nr:hypothetical protein HUJ04_001688 [Dendroctonus ponderosae]
MSTKIRSVNRKLPPEKDLLEDASPWYSVGKILPTSTKSKADVFTSFRPTKQCVDYSISETWTKMQKGDLKVNIKQTVANYKDIPPEICKPKRPKKTKLFSGGPPQWKFIDELWRLHVEGAQVKLKSEQKITSKQIKVQRALKHRNVHCIVQEMVGPDWFIELNPKQLQAVDELPHAVWFDFSKGGTMYCEELLAELGLVLRPNQYHVRKALLHSCGDPVEFLLVLYQLMNPARTSYSLNDRLVLSAVVHLSLMSTLKELHVRIPSPPNLPGQPPVLKKKLAKKTQISPYLQSLTYQPPPPRFSGVYKNKHRQYPQSRYFAYKSALEQQKKINAYGPPAGSWSSDDEMQEYMKEYRAAQEFYQSLAGVKQEMLYLIPAKILRMCPNFLHSSQKVIVNQKLIAPKLCKVSSSEELICFCDDSLQTTEDNLGKTFKRSVCEKRAQEFLDTQCFCDDCLEQLHQKVLIRIHGGFKNTPCHCEAPIPIIQGSVSSKVCDCYREYRNRVVASAARQRLIDQDAKLLLGGVFMTKLGPIYQIVGTRGGKICLCEEILKRKALINQYKESLMQNDTKLVVGGVTMTKLGPIFCVSTVVARKPCRCILSYRKKLEVLIVQNKVRAHPVILINNGLVQGKLGPVFYFSGVPDVPRKTEQLSAACSCEIVKSKCLQHCLDYLEYNSQKYETQSISSSEDSCSENCKDESSQSCSGDCSLEVNDADANLDVCCHVKTKNSTESTETTSSESSTKPSTAGSFSNSDSIKSCKCKSELDRFMQSKCPCEECNRKIRQEYATLIMGGAKTTPSGNQINVVQAVHQPLCSCMHDHLNNRRKIDEYKARIQARYNLKKQRQKYQVSGVTNTPKGPVYIIAGMRAPVDCECAKAIRESQELAAFEKQRAKPIKGRLKYGIAGVKGMPDENIYIVSGSVPVRPCACEHILAKFERAHKGCLEEFEQFMQQSENEKSVYETELDVQTNRRSPLRSIDINFAKGFENFPSNMFMIKQSEHGVQEMEKVLDEIRQMDATTPDSLKNPIPVDEAPPCSESDELNCAESHEIEDPTQCSTDVENPLDDTLEAVESKQVSSSSSEDSDSTVSESASCHVDPPRQILPITIPQTASQPESFLSKRFAIFRRLPTCRKTLMQLVKRILEGMAEDGFPLAKLPQVYKLPIFKLWIEMRCGVCWSYEDKVKSYGVSKSLWRHTDVCYKHLLPTTMPYTIAKARMMTWKDAKHIKRVAAEKQEEFYRQLKNVNIDTGREFFATTFAYEFPTPTWRECAFAYIPTKEENIFPFKVVQPHEARIIPDNRKIHCYC